MDLCVGAAYRLGLTPSGTARALQLLAVLGMVLLALGTRRVGLPVSPAVVVVLGLCGLRLGLSAPDVIFVPWGIPFPTCMLALVVVGWVAAPSSYGAALVGLWLGLSVDSHPIAAVATPGLVAIVALASPRPRRDLAALLAFALGAHAASSGGSLVANLTWLWTRGARVVWVAAPIAFAAIAWVAARGHRRWETLGLRERVCAASRHRGGPVHHRAHRARAARPQRIGTVTATRIQIGITLGAIAACAATMSLSPSAALNPLGFATLERLVAQPAEPDGFDVIDGDWAADPVTLRVQTGADVIELALTHPGAGSGTRVGLHFELVDGLDVPRGVIDRVGRALMKSAAVSPWLVRSAAEPAAPRLRAWTCVLALLTWLVQTLVWVWRR